ncbi:MAG TPA: hypothetical protein VHK88_01700 [Aquihabitans sp.]|jgi:hypothetical protein|nr:hypothetical protein [Aquihabitans sp.]
MTPKTATPPPRASLLARFGPLTAVLIAIGLVAAFASTGRDDQELTSGPGSENVAGSANEQLPISWSEAEEAGTTADLDFGEHCDEERGTVMVPTAYAPPCQAARAGVKGGATSPGVTADAIKVVLYEAADDDLAAALQSKSDPNDKQRETRTKLIQMYEEMFQTWGRTVDIEFFKGTGSDETSSRADAVTVATELGAFASIGGPNQQGAYADELSQRGVICIGCGLSVPDSTFQDNAPYMWGSSQTPEQYLVTLGDYIIERLFKKKAEFAGDPAMRERERVFGSINFEQDPPVFTETKKIVAERGAKRGYKAKVAVTYQLVIAQLAETARSLIGQMKEAGVTTVIFLGDPIMPQYLTQAATDQGYFPEWIITGTVLTDTTVFGRGYDQRQWANAFGISGLSARVPQQRGEGYRLHTWYYSAEPVAPKTVAVLHDPIRNFMLGIHQAGPNLTPETFRDGLFALPPKGGTPTTPHLSFGDHGIHEAPDYLGYDDMMEVWWDPEATGKDEQGNEGKGMMRYADGGKRYLPGKMPKEEPHAFVEEGSVTGYEDFPPEDAPPDYPSPAAGG